MILGDFLVRHSRIRRNDENLFGIGIRNGAQGDCRQDSADGPELHRQRLNPNTVLSPMCVVESPHRTTPALRATPPWPRRGRKGANGHASPHLPAEPGYQTPWPDSAAVNTRSPHTSNVSLSAAANRARLASSSGPNLKASCRCNSNDSPS